MGKSKTSREVAADLLIKKLHSVASLEELETVLCEHEFSEITRKEIKERFLNDKPKSPEDSSEASKKILRPIWRDPIAIIAPCDGTETLAGASDVFDRINSNFINWETDKPGDKTEETVVVIYELTSDATFKDMFNSLPSDLADLCLTQAQIKKRYSLDLKYKINLEDYSTFFLFRVGDQFFVAYVYMWNGLTVDVYRLENDFEWCAADRYWVIVPQLPL